MFQNLIINYLEYHLIWLKVVLALLIFAKLNIESINLQNYFIAILN